MRRFVLGLLLVQCATECPAGVLRCSFTEPFFTLTFDSTTHKVIRVTDATSDKEAKLVTTVISSNARLERAFGEGDSLVLELTDGSTIFLVLHLNGRGSDGMSENIVPFRADYGRQQGACDTNKYPSWDFDDLVEDLRARR